MLLRAKSIMRASLIHKSEMKIFNYTFTRRVCVDLRGKKRLKMNFTQNMSNNIISEYKSEEQKKSILYAYSATHKERRNFILYLVIDTGTRTRASVTVQSENIRSLRAVNSAVLSV